ncbi:uncharacterized protein LOC123564019 [Mercenaria mercenaria]|uniref:uncharacterized protein LOC123564019 n=1 Tax=Mercenaria mercenaria TaxID=6596 RepID=UPI00234E67BF|nr:uncharacterized protein LOC123564019 [Mercenaria mercenaria]
MDEQKRRMVITCGQEEIIVECNDLDSDDTELSDLSSCPSDSDYEEIEVNLPSVTPTECRDNKLLNPYVRLVRCDHLITKTLSTVNTTVEDRVQIKPNKFRSSPRRRRANCIYNSDEFVLFDYKFINKPKSQSWVKKKVSKYDKKGRPTVNIGCFPKRKRLKRSQVEFNGDHYSSSLPRFSYNDMSNGILNHGLALSENIKLEFVNDEAFQNNTYNFTKSALGLSTIESNETTAKPWVSAVIKSEPIDEYFKETIENDFDFLSSTTSIKNCSFDQVKSEEIIDTFIRIVPRHNETLPENNVGIAIKPVVKTEIIEMDVENDVSIIKTERNIESSDSEVDVENDWDGPVFIVDPEIIAFDHPYSSPCSAVRTSTRSPCSTVRTSTRSPCSTVRTSTRSPCSTVRTSTRSPCSTVRTSTRSPCSTVRTSTRSLCNAVRTSTQNKEKRASISAFQGIITERAVSSLQTISSSRASTDKPSTRMLIKNLGEKAATTIASDTVLSTEERLRHHNILERARRKYMAESFRQLRDVIPELESNERAAKKDILNKAVRYIRNLEHGETILRSKLVVLNERKVRLTKIRDRTAAYN